ncbi:hypothetical protein [uncultured Lacinutrix sp.]|uniref:hypothetical protein n=1 Tax=uncultured Lacinutrix sp. TaxID=574032 RepID=UPI002603461C|nr:hypothetical protein [uncultured Lacinutrix sp.]
MKNISKSFLSVLCLAIALLTTTLTSAQSKSKEKDFVISIKKDAQNMTLRCIRGCAWTNLEFDLNSVKTVDQYGTVSADSKSQNQDPKLASFQFSIDFVNGKFVLKGLKGTAWNTLNFESEIINKDGVLPKS